MADRRRINGPAGGTTPPVFLSASTDVTSKARPSRTRALTELRKIFLKTGLTPSASGSAYLELQPSPAAGTDKSSLIPQSSNLKITCTVHGPRPLPRSAPFTPQILLSTHVKFAPFAERQRRGYLRDTSERDLAVHLETALRGVIIGDRWPKSGIEVVVTILEGEEGCWWGEESSSGGIGQGANGSSGMMSILAGCITVASAAIVDAGIDCVDLITGGVAAVVQQSSKKQTTREPGSAANGQESNKDAIILDPNPSEHQKIQSACVVGYLQSRDEITVLWVTGSVPGADRHQILDNLVDSAVHAAEQVRVVLVEAVKESVQHER